MLNVLAVVFWAVSAAPAPRPWFAQTAAPEGGTVSTASIAGTVTGADSGRPIGGVQVTLSLRPASKAITTAMTDDDGKYEMLGVPVGRYLVAFSKPGFVQARYGQRHPADDAKFVQVRKGQVLKRIDGVLWRAAAMEGRVVREDGAGIEGATVIATWAQDSRAGGPPVWDGPSAQTDAQGTYRLQGLHGGEYYVSVRVDVRRLLTSASRGKARPDETLGQAVGFYPGVSDPSAAALVTVQPAVDVSGIDIVLRPVRLAKVSGTMLTSTGRVLDGAYVGLRSSRRAGVNVPPGFIGVSRVGGDGSFAIEGVPPGSYLLQAWSVPKSLVDKTAMTGNPAALLSSPEGEFATLVIVVTGEDISGITLTTSRGGRIRGRLVHRDKALTPAEQERIVVAAEPVTPDAVAAVGRSTLVGRDGRFELRGLVGRFVLRVGRLPRSMVLARVEAGGSDVTDDGLHVPAGADVSDIEIVVSSRVSELRGRLLEWDRDGSRECTVVAFSEDSLRWSWPATRYVQTAPVDREGSFAIRGLPAGRYYVAAVDSMDSSLLQPENLSPLATNASRVGLQEGERHAINLRTCRD